jgi:signal transduction histidine kinase
MTFHLVRYFTLASLAAFIVVTAVLSVAHRHIAIENMIALEESNNVNLTKTFANSLWAKFKPFVDEAQKLNRQQIQTSPQQAVLQKQVLELMRGLSVVKVKVYDLHGLTVFSTQASQIGDDKSKNGGFVSARKGINASELTHRDTFSAFEETIENRDVLSSYIPIVGPQSRQIEGVFEIYSDVTPFLHEIDRTTWIIVGTVVGVLTLLYLTLFLIVKRADMIIQQQARENARVQSHLAQNEKMVSLGQMVAGVAHELNTPVAFTRSNVSMVKDFIEELRLPLMWGSKLIRQLRVIPTDQINLKICLNNDIREQMGRVDDELTAEQLKQMLEQSLAGLEQMAELVTNLQEFTRLDRAKIADFDINKGLNNVLYIAKNAVPEQITIAKELGNVPTLRCMPSQVNQIFINLITNAAQAIDGTGTITLRTSVQEAYVKIEVEDNGCGIAEDVREHIFDAFYTTKDAGEGTGLGLSIVRDIVQEHGGLIHAESAVGVGTKFTVLLPINQKIEQPLAA